MKKTVVIVDSISKKNILSKYLGGNYQVLAILGPLSRLPKQGLIPDEGQDFKVTPTMSYVQEDTLRRLVEAVADANRIYIATAPDLPGESLAQDLAEKMAVANGNIKRLRLREITESTLFQAIKKPYRINENFVHAHQARCVFDHLIDRRIGPLVSQAVGRPVKLSYASGLALRLVRERELEVAGFVPREYWSLQIRVQKGPSRPFLAKLILLKGQPPEIPSQHHAKAMISDLKELSLKVRQVEKRRVMHPAVSAFTTVKLQQEAARRFGFSAQRTMIIAKQLYEAVELGPAMSTGLISYFNTDTTEISEKAALDARELILLDYGKDYLRANDAHDGRTRGSSKRDEAIRPTEVKRTPKKVKRFLTDDQLKLYSLIWSRFVASQMTSPVSEQTVVDCVAGEDNRYLFRALGKDILFRGHWQVYDGADGEDQESETTKIPTELHANDLLKICECIPVKSFTRAPKLFSEATLLAELENQGLGRLSLQGSVVSDLFSAGLLERQGVHLIATQTGRSAGNLLVEFFPDIFSFGFAARLDEDFAQIERGGKTYQTVLNNLYKPLSRAVEHAKARQSGLLPTSTALAQQICPLCGANLVAKWGRNGQYFACALYPSRCSFTKVIGADADRDYGKCKKCGREMVVRMGKNGKFLACSGYPICDHSESVPLEVKCPAEGCQGNVVERLTAKGRRFYGCSLYPECTFSSWQLPANIVCPSCGNLYLVTHSTRARGDFYRCPQCKKRFNLDLLLLNEEHSQAGLA